MSVNTFGCGEFLPGRGPFNFPDFIDEGNVNDPDPPNPDPPGVSTEADPFGPPTIVDEGPPPPPAPRPPVVVPPGINEPGDPPAVVPGNFCRCVIVGTGALQPVKTLPNGSRVYTFIFEQTCKRLPDDTQNPNQGTMITDPAVVTVELADPNGVFTFPLGTGFTDCNTNPPNSPVLCDGKCGVITLVYTVAGEVSPPYNDPDPVPQNPGTPNRVVNKCVYTGEAPVRTLVSETPLGSTYRLEFAQECKQFPPATPNPNIARLNRWEQDNVNASEDFQLQTRGFEDCPRNGPCDPVIGTLFVPRDLINVGEPTPGGPGDSPFTPISPQDPIGATPRGGNVDVTSIGNLPEGGGVTGVTDDSGPGGTFIGEVPEASGVSPIVSIGGATNFSVNFQKISPKNVGQIVETSEKIDLSDPILSNYILSERPSGFEDEEIFFNDTPEKPVKVRNTSRVTDIFSEYIDDTLLYMLENPNKFGDWDSSKAGAITVESVYSNLNEETKQILSKILNYDRSPINRVQIFGMIGSRILDGTIKNVNKGTLLKLQKAGSKEKSLEITRSKSSIVNETVALGLVERNFYSLEPSSYSGRAAETMKNRKVLSSDIDRYIDVTVRGEVKRYYVNDDETFIERSTLALKDGEYFDITLGGEVSRLYAKSEKDHAYLVPEKTRQIAINILGGDPNRTLTVSGDPKGIELDYSLSSPRQDIYFLSCVLSSVTSTPDTQGSRHLKSTTARYENVSLSNIDEINEYIKYKENHQTFILDDEDLILDYVERDGKLFLSQTDIIVDSPKENKTMPLLTRQVPWYILLYPTNNPENNPFNAKSQIVNITPSSNLVEASVTRQLRTKTSITPKFRNTYNQFISTELVGIGAVDVYDKKTNQARINKLNLDNVNIKSGYVDNNKNLIPAQEYTPSRRKTGYRLMAEIVTELDRNYLLGLNGIGKSLTEFDVFSRLTFNQFNRLSRLENFRAIKNTIFNGMIQDVKVTPGTKNSDAKLAIKKTQLVRRKSTASEKDQFPEIKATNFNRAISPPTTENPPSFGPSVPPAPPTALP